MSYFGDTLIYGCLMSNVYNIDTRAKQVAMVRHVLRKEDNDLGAEMYGI